MYLFIAEIRHYGTSKYSPQYTVHYIPDHILWFNSIVNFLKLSTFTNFIFRELFI